MKAAIVRSFVGISSTDASALRQIWMESGNDQARFVSALLKLTGGDMGLPAGREADRAAHASG